MNIRIFPGKAAGTVKAPPAKSLTHRLLITAALSDGESRIENAAFPEDILATMECIRTLGKTVRVDGDAFVLSGPGIGRYRWRGETADLHSARDCEAVPVLPVRESASTLRFLIPTVLTLGCPVRFTGEERLFRRPLSVYEELAEREGFRFEKEAGALLVCGSLRPETYEIPANISSQFISGLLFALPRLQGDSMIRLIPPVESRPYIDMTLSVLEKSGVRTVRLSEEEILVPGGQEFHGFTETVEGGFSNGAYLALLNVLGGETEITGLPDETVQGDRVFRAYYKKLQEGFAELDLTDCPDLGPCMFAAAASLHGGRFTGTARLRLKESDRCESMQEELKKFGIRCSVEDNSFTVEPGTLAAPREILSGHHDHRVVMALSALLTVTGGEIGGSEAAAKSYPEFFEVLKQLGIQWHVTA